MKCLINIALLLCILVNVECLICPSCFSKESVEKCNVKAEVCEEENDICTFYYIERKTDVQGSLVKQKRFIQGCMSKKLYDLHKLMCSLPRFKCDIIQVEGCKNDGNGKCA